MMHAAGDARRETADPPFFVDIHSHVVPSGDDGVQTPDEARALCAEAARRGTRLLFATPHASPDYPLTAERERLARGQVAELRSEVALELRLGFELTPTHATLDEDLARYALDGTDLVLVDAPLADALPLLLAVGDRIVEQGLRPVLGHPEEFIPLGNDRRLAWQLVERGWLLQVGRRALLGRSGQIVEAIAWMLIETGMATIVASDAHNVRTPPFLDVAYALIVERFGTRARALLDGSAVGLS